jgi:transposase
MSNGDEISFPKRKQPKYDMSVKGDMYPSYSTIKNRVAKFRTGHLSTEDECSGRPSQVTTSENVDAIHFITLNDQRT